MSGTKAFFFGLTIGVVILMAIQADALNITREPQQLEPAGEVIEGLLDRRRRRRESGEHALCGKFDDMNWLQRQRVANFGTPKWCYQ